MIKLENIQRRGSIIYATVRTVEMQPQIFEIAVDVLKKEVIKNTHNKIDSNVSMAMAKLITLSE